MSEEHCCVHHGGMSPDDIETCAPDCDGAVCVDCIPDEISPISEIKHLRTATQCRMTKKSVEIPGRTKARHGFKKDLRRGEQLARAADRRETRRQDADDKAAAELDVLLAEQARALERVLE